MVHMILISANRTNESLIFALLLDAYETKALARMRSIFVAVKIVHTYGFAGINLLHLLVFIYIQN